MGHRGMAKLNRSMEDVSIENVLMMEDAFEEDRPSFSATRMKNVM